MILLESIESKMQITFEAVSSLNDKIDGVDERLNSRMDRSDLIQQATVDAIAAVHIRIDAVDKKLSSKIDAVHSELIAHRNDTELHRNPPKRTLKSLKP